MRVGYFRPSFMPGLYPGEHLLSALNRAVLRGSVPSSKSLIAGPYMEAGTLIPGEVLRPLYLRISEQFPELTLQELMQRHTLWPYFRPFFPKGIDLPPESSWKEFYQNRGTLTPSADLRVRHARQWRWCVECARQDFDHYGLGYWHLEHQIPGQTVCQQHPNEPLQGACSDCGSRISALSKKIRLYPGMICPICHQQMGSTRTNVNHPSLDWLLRSSTGLQSGLFHFDWWRAKCDIFECLGFVPQSRNTLAQNKAISRMKARLMHGIPLDVRNWLFQSHEGGLFREHDRISALCLRQLYDDSLMVHPVSGLLFTWILLRDTHDLSAYFTNRTILDEVRTA